MSAILDGHSFVRRMRGAALGHPYDQKREDVQDTTTAETLVLVCIVNKQLKKFTRVQMLTLLEDFPIRLRTTCDIVLIDFRSNDLANLKYVTKRFCEKILHF